MPLTMRTPVPGSAASLDRTSSPVRPQARPRPGGPTRTSPQTAPAATEVVRSGGAAVLIVTLSPASARLIPVVRPHTPAPITSASMLRRYRVPGTIRPRAAGSGAPADEGEGLELGALGGRRALGAGGRVDRVRAGRVVLRDGDAGVAGEVLRVGVDVEHRDPVAGRGVASGRPGRVFHRVSRRPGADVWRRGQGRAVGPGEHLGLALPVGRAEPAVVQVGVGAAAAQD